MSTPVSTLPAAASAVAVPAAAEQPKKNEPRKEKKKKTPPAALLPNETITEGSVSIEYECRSGDTAGKGTAANDGPVFYNKVQVFNRDLSVLVISLFAQWRYIEKEELKAKKAGNKTGEAGAGMIAAEAKRKELYGLSAIQLDARLRETASTDGIEILDALAATGLRSIRYAKEVPGVKCVVSNDFEVDATAAAERNISQNGAADVCTAQNADALLAMIESKAGGRRGSQYDVIDLDPYGSAAPFVDGAVQALADGGLLCVTSTDMAVLSGNYPEVCYAKYGSMPIKSRFLHENALRILLHTLEAAATKYKRHIVPVLSLSIDFYIRVFVRVFERPQEVKQTASKRGFILQSGGCPTFYVQPVSRPENRADGHGPAFLHHGNARKQRGATPAARRKDRKKAEQDEDAGVEDDAAEQLTGDAKQRAEGMKVQDVANAGKAESDLPSSVTAADFLAPAFCNETGAPFKLAGPTWIAPLHDFDWVTAALDRLDCGADAFLSTQERLHGVLTAVSEELPDVPLYYTLPDLCAALHCSSPKMAEVKAALMHAGFRCSQTHREPDAVKTDAPPRVVWDIMRAWCKKHPVSEKRLSESRSAAAKILATEPTLEVSFATTAALRAKPKARRWAPNPEEYWGPKAASHGRKKSRPNL